MQEIVKTARKNWIKKKIASSSIVLLTGIAVCTIDYFIKQYCRTHLAYQSIPVIPDIFHITIVFNKGAAFGILQGRTFLLSIIGLSFIVFLAYLLRRESKPTYLFLIGAGLIMGGACSNLIDRLTLGYVVDYLDFRIWPVFNLSDSAICVGAGLIILDSFRRPKKIQDA